MKISHDGRVVTLEFDHGKANEMGSEQLRALEELAAELRGGEALALISFSRRVSRRGTPIFVSGANVTERQGWADDEVARHVAWQRRTLAAIRHLPLFHVAVVDGVALGWGTEWMITADYRIATPRAIFGLPETGLGIVPGAGGSSELPSLIGLPQTLRLGMTGERIDAAEAARIGLVQETAADLDAGLERARALAATVARKSPTSIAAFKAATLGGIGRPPEDRAGLEAAAYEHCLRSGEAAIGRAHFQAIREGGDVPWGPRRRQGE